MGALGDGRVDFVAEAVFEQPASVDLPTVLNIEVGVVAGDGSHADLITLGKERRSHGLHVGKGAGGE